MWRKKKQRPRRDSNPQSSDPKSDALSIRPRGHTLYVHIVLSSIHIVCIFRHLTFVQISPVSTSPALSDNSTFETFYRVVSSDAAVVEGIVNIALQFNWSRIAVISQQENIFTSVSDQICVIIVLSPALKLSEKPWTKVRGFE